MKRIEKYLKIIYTRRMFSSSLKLVGCCISFKRLDVRQSSFKSLFGLSNLSPVSSVSSGSGTFHSSQDDLMNMKHSFGVLSYFQKNDLRILSFLGIESTLCYLKLLPIFFCTYRLMFILCRCKYFVII